MLLRLRQGRLRPPRQWYLRGGAPGGNQGEGDPCEGGRRAGAALRRGHLVAQRPRVGRRPRRPLPRRHLQGPHPGPLHQLPAHRRHGHLHGLLHRVRRPRLGPGPGRRRQDRLHAAGLRHRQGQGRPPHARAPRGGPRRHGAQLPGGAARRRHQGRRPRRRSQHPEPAARQGGRARRRPRPHRLAFHVLPGILLRLRVPGHLHRPRRRPRPGGRHRRQARARDPRRGGEPLHRAQVLRRLQDRRRHRHGVVLHHHHPQPDLQPLGGEDFGVEGDITGGAGDVVQHHTGDGEAVPVQEAGLGDLLCSPCQLSDPSISILRRSGGTLV